MPPQIVRITLDLHDKEVVYSFIKKLEYGEIYDRELTKAENDELDELEKLLAEFSDFTSATALEDTDRQELMKKKQRYEQLKAIEDGEPQFIWKAEDLSTLRTLLVMLRFGDRPIYAENIPTELLDKMLDPNIMVNVGESPVYPSDIDTPTLTQAQPTQLLEANNSVFIVREVISRINVSPTMSANKGTQWVDLVEIGTKNPAPGQQTLANTVYIMPIKYMKDDWQPINDALKATFGDKLNWTRTGKQSHWWVCF